MSIARAVGRDAAWWSVGAGRIARHSAAGLMLLVGTTLLLWVAGVDLRWLGIAAVVAIGLALWARFSPTTFARVFTSPLWRRRIKRRVRTGWPALVESCGLGRTDRVRSVRELPTLGRLRWDERGNLAAPVVLITGQTVDDIDAIAERLRAAVDARALQVRANERRTGCELVWSFTDALAQLVPFVGPNPVAVQVGLDSVLVGRAEDGSPFNLDVRVSTLTVGATGAGKASVMWNVVLGQAPNIRSGLVEFHGADLKGGMELSIGAALFTRVARSSGEAVAMLEHAAAACDARAVRFAGSTRSHQPTRSDPVVIILIDELAALVAYETDRDVLKRVDAALRRLLAMGRAVGFYVFAFVQDPRKETVGMRHMFPQKVALRLDEAAEVDMVLGEGARRRGAEAHRISRSTPGVGYAVAEDGQVVRFRAAHIADDLIQLVASTNPAPRQQPISAGPSEPTTTSGAGGRPTSRRSGSPARKAPEGL